MLKPQIEYDKMDINLDVDHAKLHWIGVNEVLL